MTLEQRCVRLIQEWRRMAKAYRLAQDESAAQSNEWRLNAASAEGYERCVNELVKAVQARSESTDKGVRDDPGRMASGAG